VDHLQLLPSCQGAEERRPVGRAVAGTLVAHAVALAALAWLTHVGAREASRVVLPLQEPQRIVWVAMPGPNGGGGGSKVTVPKPPAPTPPQATRTPETPAPTPVVVPEQITPPTPAPVEPQPATNVLADTSSSGAAGPPSTVPGNGTGGGNGDGDGAGTGKGNDKGFGGNSYLPGNGVTSPEALVRAQPKYTAEAMRARAQGSITVECVVEPDGVCGEMRIVRAFAPPFGLDQQALDAASKWRFRPGTREGKPVPVRINLILDFSIH
jgi:TonB family protein